METLSNAFPFPDHTNPPPLLIECVYVSDFSHCCDQMPEQKQLKGGSIYLGSLFDMISSIKEEKAHTGAEVAGHIYITGQETESRQDVGLGSQISRPPPR